MENINKFKKLKKLKKKRGFTLIELVVVIAIIAILITLVAPNISKYIRNAKQIRADSAAKSLFVAATNSNAIASFSSQGLCANTGIHLLYFTPEELDEFLINSELNFLKNTNKEQVRQDKTYLVCVYNDYVKYCKVFVDNDIEGIYPGPFTLENGGNDVPLEQKYLVQFFNGDDEIPQARQRVIKHTAANAPPNPTKEGLTFIKWDKEFNDIVEDTKVYALFEDSFVSCPHEYQQKICNDCSKILERNYIDGSNGIFPTTNLSYSENGAKQISQTRTLAQSLRRKPSFDLPNDGESIKFPELDEPEESFNASDYIFPALDKIIEKKPTDITNETPTDEANEKINAYESDMSRKSIPVGKENEVKALITVNNKYVVKRDQLLSFEDEVINEANGQNKGLYLYLTKSIKIDSASGTHMYYVYVSTLSDKHLKTILDNGQIKVQDKSSEYDKYIFDKNKLDTSSIFALEGEYMPYEYLNSVKDYIQNNFDAKEGKVIVLKNQELTKQETKIIEETTPAGTANKYLLPIEAFEFKDDDGNVNVYIVYSVTKKYLHIYTPIYTPGGGIIQNIGNSVISPETSNSVYKNPEYKEYTTHKIFSFDDDDYLQACPCTDTRYECVDCGGIYDFTINKWLYKHKHNEFAQTND